jgi:hypothetical protein
LRGKQNNGRVEAVQREELKVVSLNELGSKRTFKEFLKTEA